MRRGALCIAARVVALGAALPACGSELDDPYVILLAQHAAPGEPGPDTSNALIGDPAAIALGKRFYFDPDFSGAAVNADMLLRPMVTPGRAALGQPVRVACNTCHDVARGGADHTPDPPGNVVSFGGGAYDLNGQQTVNSAYPDLVYWNGRNDSLWSQIVAVVESHVSVNGSRLRTAWRIADAYRAEYTALFPDHPLPPQLDSIAAHKARLEPDGTCKLVAGACPLDHCQEQWGPCLPRFPLEGRPGFVRHGEQPACEWGDPNLDPLLQPYGDAWDCMGLADQLQVTRIYVNFAKAIAAYEYTLISKDSPFDRWAAGGFQPGTLGPAAERGARLFVGKAACRECHGGPLFLDDAFHQIGVPQVGRYIPTTAECPAGDAWCDCVSEDRFEPRNCLALGARDGLRKLQASRFRRDSVWSDDVECRRHYTAHVDPSYAAAHPEECDGRVKYYSMPLTDDLRGAWRTPGLRDVALTAPYMHTGMYATLREVVEHYNRGGKVAAGVGGELVGTIDPLVVELNLTELEVDDLVAFLESLTGRVDPDVIAPPAVPPDSPF